MCGILAMFGPHIQPLIPRAQHALGTLHHRGPDGSDSWHNQTTFLGHTRLSLIDLEGGKQPLSNENHRIFAVVNGEFYDHRSIRSELEGMGHQFRTQSDSELLIHLYEAYGTDALSHLRGEFSFVLWDANTQHLFAARDRFGIKPLFYTWINDTLLIASEVKALFAMGAPKHWNNQALYQCAHLHYTLPTQTLFDNIHQCAPGHMIQVPGTDPRQLRHTKYWDFNYPQQDQPFQYSEGDAIARFGALLDDAVQVRLQADVEVGCYLSGGLDSCGILGLTMTHRDTPIKCFSLSFDDDAYDEFDIAQAMAQHANASFYPVRVKRRELIDHLDRAIYHAEGIVINGHLSAKYLLSRAARDANVKAVLAGEGADEITAGYPHLRQDLLSLSQHAVDSLYKKNTVAQGIFLASGDGLDLGNVHKRLGFVPSFLKAKAALGLRIRALLNPSFIKDLDHRDPYDAMLDCFDIEHQLKGIHPVHQSMYLWSKLSLANYILRMIGDSTEMAHSIEGRLPFLDHHLVEFTTQVPMHMKIRGGIEKYIQREATKHVLTPTVYTRQKHALITPPSNDITLPLIRERLQSQSFRQMHIFDNSAISSLLDQLEIMTPKQRALADPVIMFLLSTHAIDRTLLS